MAKIKIKFGRRMFNIFFLIMFINLWLIVVLPELRTMETIFFILGFIAYWFLTKKAKLNKDIRLGTNFILVLMGILIMLYIFVPESRDASFIYIAIGTFSYIFITRKEVITSG